MSLDNLARRYRPDAKIEKEPQTPEERLNQLRALGDEALNEKLANWQNIRIAQENHAGVPDDVVQLGLLFRGINQDLSRLGKRQLRSEEELP